jgi:hypothetical protein
MGELRTIGTGVVFCLFAAAGVAAREPLESPPIRHVFLIVLENKSFSDTFASSRQDPYLRKTLPQQGALLTQYYGTGHSSLDNYIAMISGQSSTRDTEADCEEFSDFAFKRLDSDGQAVGTGCVYPSRIKTLADQLESAGLTWRGYMEDMGNDPEVRSEYLFGVRTLSIRERGTAQSCTPDPLAGLTASFRFRSPTRPQSLEMLKNRRNRRGSLSIKSEKAEPNNFAAVQQEALPTESGAEGINAFSIVGAEREGRMLRGSLLTPGRRGASQHRPGLPSVPSHGAHSSGVTKPGRTSRGTRACLWRIETPCRTHRSSGRRHSRALVPLNTGRLTVIAWR